MRGAVRALRHSPGFAITVILTLAIGIGLNDAIFTVVDCVLLRPLGYRDADRIVALHTYMQGRSSATDGMGGDDYNDLAREVHGIAATAFYTSDLAGVRSGNDAAYVQVAAVSPRFGEVIGVEPVAGRLFRGDATEGTEALVSMQFGQAHFGTAASALGHVVQSGSFTRVIVGVLPAGFNFPEGAAIWLETGPRPDVASRTAYNQRVIGKRREGTSPEQLTAELQTFSHNLATGFPEDRGKQIEAVSLQDEVVGPVRSTLRLLMGAVAVILLIVCTNITHLQIVRSTREMRSVTVRIALGAKRSRLAAEALAGSTLLAAAGAGMAALLAIPALKGLLRLVPAAMPRLTEVHLNRDVFLLSVALSAGLMAITSVLPILRTWNADPAAALRNDSTRGMEGRGAHRLRNVLLVTEVAFTLILSVAAVLLTRQLLAEAQVDLGFRANRLLTLDLHFTGAPPMDDLPEDASKRANALAFDPGTAAARASQARLEAVLGSVAGVPGVNSASAIEGAPMGFGAVDVRYAIRGRQVFGADNRLLPDADIHAVSADLFATLGVPLLRGRALTKADKVLAPSVVLINAALARQEFSGQDPIGKQVMAGYDADSSWWTIVGVVGDVRAETPGTPVAPTLYVPLAQHAEKAAELQLVVQAAADPSGMAEALRRVLHQQYPDMAVHFSTMAENIAETQKLEHLRSVLFSSFAAVALFLAAIGIYGVTTYSVAQRRFEFGLRLAVGASRAQLLSLVLREALRLALLGTAAGVVLSLALVRLLSVVVGQLPAFDGAAYAVAIAGVLTLAALAAFLPARRAAGAEPMQVLRYE